MSDLTKAGLVLLASALAVASGMTGPSVQAEAERPLAAIADSAQTGHRSL